MTTVTAAPLPSGKVNAPEPSRKWKWSGVLGAREVATSSTLLRRLEARGLTPEQARQALLRDFTSANGVWRSERLRLEGGGRLFAYKSFFGDAPFLEAVRPVLADRRRGVARVLEAIERLPALDIDSVTKLLACDHRDNEHVAGELSAVEEMGLGVFEDGVTARRRLVRKAHAGTPEGTKLAYQLLAQRETERMWVNLLLHHFALHNLIVWKARELRYSPHVGGQLFSATGYSYIRPLVRFNRGDPKPIACPVVFDVLGRPAEVFDIAGFLERIHRAGANPQGKLRIMGVVGAPWFQQEAFDLARRNGLVVVSFKEAFGEVALDILAHAEELLRGIDPIENVGSQAIAKLAASFAESIEELKHHPLVTQLSGLALESLACAVIGAQGFQNVHSGERVSFEENGVDVGREVDASGQRGDEWRVIECKAINEKAELDSAAVKRFFTETVPAFIKSRGKTTYRTWRAELWTTGLVSDETRQLLNEKWTPRGVTAAILTKDQIPIPHQLRPLHRILEVVAAL